MLNTVKDLREKDLQAPDTQIHMHYSSTEIDPASAFFKWVWEIGPGQPVGALYSWFCNVALLVGGVPRRGTKDPLPQQQPLDPSAVLRLPGHRARLPGEPTVAVVVVVVVVVVVFSCCEMRPCRELCSVSRVLH